MNKVLTKELLLWHFPSQISKYGSVDLHYPNDTPKIERNIEKIEQVLFFHIAF